MTDTDNQEIIDLEFTEDEKEDGELIDLRLRAVVFLLDYSLLIAAIYFSYQFLSLFINNISDEITYTLIGFYSILFVLMEQKYEGSIFKKLFKIKNVTMDNKKLGIHIFAIKLVLRPIAFFIALIYLKFCMAILLWIFGIHKPLFKFFRGEIYVLWYDYSINQMTVKVS